MSDIKWIKISVDMFDDEKIKIIEKMPEADTLLIIWIKLLALAGRKNSSGYIFLTENIPYTDDMLAVVMGRDLGIVRLALDTFEKFGMIHRSEEQMILISNWDKHQSVDRMESIKIQQKLRKQKERRKRQLLEEGVPPAQAEEISKQEIYGQKKDSHVTVTGHHAQEEEEEREEEEEKERDIKKIIVEDQDPPTPSSKGTGKKKRIYDEDSIEYKLADRLYKRILENYPELTKPDLHKWADVIRLMIEKDQRTPEQIAALIDWAQQDTFWISNILSTTKLRAKWDTLKAQYLRDRKGGNHGQAGRHHAGAHGKNTEYSAGAEGLFRK